MKMQKALEDAGIKKKDMKGWTESHGEGSHSRALDCGYNQALTEINTLSISINREMFLGEYQLFWDENEVGNNDGTPEEFLEILANTDGIIKIGRNEDENNKS